MLTDLSPVIVFICTVHMTNTNERNYTVGNSPVSVGRFTYGVENVTIKQWGEGASLRIGSFCSIASSIEVFLGGNHRTDWITTFPFGHIFCDELGGTDIRGHPATKGDVTIGDDVWIGHGVTILSGVSIGSGAVLAAKAVICKDVAPYEIVGGNPAKLLKKRFDDQIVDLMLTLRWWDLPLEAIRDLAPELSKAPVKQLLLELVSRYRA